MRLLALTLKSLIAGTAKHHTQPFPTILHSSLRVPPFGVALGSAMRLSGRARWEDQKQSSTADVDEGMQMAGQSRQPPEGAVRVFDLRRLLGRMVYLWVPRLGTPLKGAVMGNGKCRGGSTEVAAIGLPHGKTRPPLSNGFTVHSQCDGAGAHPGTGLHLMSTHVREMWMSRVGIRRWFSRMRRGMCNPIYRIFLKRNICVSDIYHKRYIGHLAQHPR